jgi:uncharacterized membrane protein
MHTGWRMLRPLEALKSHLSPVHKSNLKGKSLHTLTVGIGVVAGLRPMTALAATAWAIKRGRIRIEPTSIVWMFSAGTSKRIAQLAISELIVDKLPFTLSRLRPRPLALRIVTGAICGAAVYGNRGKRPLSHGAILGGMGALAGAIAGTQVRKRVSRDMPDLTAGLLEDVLAAGGSALVMTFAGVAG